MILGVRYKKVTGWFPVCKPFSLQVTATATISFSSYQYSYFHFGLYFLYKILSDPILKLCIVCGNFCGNTISVSGNLWDKNSKFVGISLF